MEGRYSEREMQPYIRQEQGTQYSTEESKAERERYWLSDFVTSESLEQMREAPLYGGWSTELLILERLQASVEKESYYIQPHYSRLQILFPVFRLLSYQNMNEQEQKSLAEWAQQTRVAETLTQITPEVRQDIQWLWTTFGLQRPMTGVGADILKDIPDRHQIKPSSTSGSQPWEKGQS